ncbi:MAG: hypothetical protein V3R13_02570, partial [Nitrososphaerales archaeon]
MASFEETLKVTGWLSEFRSVQRFLDHYSRKSKSEHTRRNVLGTLNSFVDFVGVKSPDEYIRGGRAKLEKDFQRFLDEMNQRDLSKTYISTA